MSTPTFSRRHWLASAAALALAACGGGADRTKARIRLVNASNGYDALDMTIDDERRFASVAYGQTASYVEVDPDRMDSTIRRPGSATALLSFTPSVSEDASYTVLAWGDNGELKSLLLDDNTGEPDDGKTLLRVLHAAPDAGDLDVYVTASDDALVDAVSLYTDPLTVGSLGGHVLVDSATWRLRVTAGGDKADLRLDVSGLTLSSATSATLVITPGRGGVLVAALLLVDRGGLQRLDNPQARVRVAAGVPGGASVTASAGAISLISQVGSPAVSLYTLVDVAAADFAVTVDGVAAGGTPAAPEAGGDYTLVVWGPASAPQMALVEDDNRLPDGTSRTQIRLVNAIADVDAALSLTVNLVPVGSGVLQGAASDPLSLTATTTAVLRLSGGGLALEATEELAAATTYSYFVFGSAADPKTQLVQDR